MKKLFALTYIYISVASISFCQLPAANKAARKIEFPDVPGYYTLKCDFHQHTVFSDGEVWPSIRVQEAKKDGLDAISITDHIEYQPHKDDIPHKDRNRSYHVAKEAAEGSKLMIINGTEITRDMPPGHANAIFLDNVNKLVVKDPVKAFRQAKEQGAFIFWNHPNWISQESTGIAKLTEMHRMLIDEGLLDGIEVVNDLTFSDEALQIALDHNLTIIGTSDIHGLVDWQYDIPYGGHRPITLVFAKERSIEGIQEALNAQRTAAWFNNLLIGREEHIMPLVKASITVENAAYKRESTVMDVVIKNHSDAEYLLENLSEYTFHTNGNVVKIEPHKQIVLQVKTIEKKDEVNLKFKLLNVITAPNTNPELVLKVK